MSVLSCLSYRKRPGLKDSIGGHGDEQTLFSALGERPPSPERAARRAARSTEPEDRAAVIARAFADASSWARQGLSKRWSLSAADGDKASVASAPVSRASSASWRGMEDEEAGDERSSVLSFALSSPGSLRSRRGGPEGRPESRLSLARSRMEEADEGSRGQPPLGRSFSVPPRPRSAASEEGSPRDARPVGHRSYLDPDLEAAIQEVLSYRPARARRCSSPDADSDDGRSVRSVRSAAPLGAADPNPGSLRRSASALDFSRHHRHRSSSCSSEEEEERKKKSSSKKRSKKSKKRSKKKKKQESSSSESDSSSDSSSGSTSSYRSTSSVKKGPKAAGGEEQGHPGRVKKEEKQRKKQVDSLMMKYLYRPESD